MCFPCSRIYAMKYIYNDKLNKACHEFDYLETVLPFSINFIGDKFNMP